MAVADDWLGDGVKDGSWRDSMVRVTGPLANDLQSGFAELWASSAGEILVGPAFYPDADTPGPAVHVCVNSSPSSEEHPLRVFFMLSILGARQRLYIASSYFVPDKHTRRAV